MGKGKLKITLFFCTALALIFVLAPISAHCKEKPITLKYASAFPEFLGPSQFAIHFMNYVEEKSHGRVKFKAYHAGLLGEIFEMLNMVSTGAIDMTIIIHPIFKEQLPLHNFPEDIAGGMDKAMDVINKLNFEIPETAALLERECKDNNIKGLRYCAMGEDGMVIKMKIDSLADLKGKKLGADKELKAYGKLGINVVSVSYPDMYEALGRGICDGLPFAIEAVASNRWYEKAKCYMYNGLYHAGMQTVINLNTWNKLPKDLQDIFEAASADTEAFSVEMDKTKTADYEKTIRDAGLYVGRLPVSDTMKLLELSHQVDKADMRVLGEKVSKSKDVEIILEHFDRLAGAQ